MTAQRITAPDTGWAALRPWLIQLAVLAGIGLLLFAIAQTTLQNLDRLGVESGFDFLGKRAGFDINQALFAYSSDSPVYIAFALAICNTLLLAAFSIVLSTLMGLAIALCRISRDWLLNAIGYGFIEIFRNIPALLQIFFWYYVVLRALPPAEQGWQVGGTVFLNNRGLFLPGLEWTGTPADGVFAVVAVAVLIALALPALLRRRQQATLSGRSLLQPALVLAGLTLTALWIAMGTDWAAPELRRFGYAADLVITPELAALILGLSFYNASSVAEVIRAGFLAVPKGQWEAARSLGLARFQVMRQVIVPQALRVIIPPLTTCYLNIFKATSLGAAIGYPEIVSVMVGTTNNLVGRPVEIMFLTFSVYALVSLLGIGVMGWLNRRHNRFAAA